MKDSGLSSCPCVHLLLSAGTTPASHPRALLLVFAHVPPRQPTHQQDVAVRPLGVVQAAQAALHGGVEICRRQRTGIAIHVRWRRGPHLQNTFCTCCACPATVGCQPQSLAAAAARPHDVTTLATGPPALTRPAVEHLLQELQQVVHALQVHVELQLAHLRALRWWGA